MAEYAKRSEVTIETMVSGPRAPDLQGAREHDGSIWTGRFVTGLMFTHLSHSHTSRLPTTYYRYLSLLPYYDYD
jgi:hypothetical protein